MSRVALWKAIPSSALLWILNIFTAVALIFEGYNQGVMGGISGTPGFINVMGIGADEVVTDSTKQGGLVAAYYGGAMFGCFAGGKIGDMLGRKKGVWIASCFCIVGAALMAGSTNSSMFVVARIIGGKLLHTRVHPSSLNLLVQAWV
jgi:MFS family permease